MNWEILKPIMALCNEQFGANMKSPRSPDKGLRSKIDVREANSANKGSNLVRRFN